MGAECIEGAEETAWPVASWVACSATHTHEEHYASYVRAEVKAEDGSLFLCKGRGSVALEDTPQEAQHDEDVQREEDEPSFMEEEDEVGFAEMAAPSAAVVAAPD
eukprot:5454965-Amphidinium_carterae.1